MQKRSLSSFPHLTFGGELQYGIGKQREERGKRGEFATERVEKSWQTGHGFTYLNFSREIWGGERLLCGFGVFLKSKDPSSFSVAPFVTARIGGPFPVLHCPRSPSPPFSHECNHSILPFSRGTRIDQSAFPLHSQRRAPPFFPLYPRILHCISKVLAYFCFYL